MKLGPGVGALARITHVEVDQQKLHSWKEADALITEIKRCAQKIFGDHPNANNFKQHVGRQARDNRRN